MRKLLKEYSRADALEPLYDLADRLLWSIREEDVHVVAGHLARDNMQFMLDRYLPNHVPCPYCNRTDNGLLPVFRYPHDVDLQIELCVGSQPVLPHPKKLTCFA